MNPQAIRNRHQAFSELAFVLEPVGLYILESRLDPPAVPETCGVNLLNKLGQTLVRLVAGIS